MANVFKGPNSRRNKCFAAGGITTAIIAIVCVGYWASPSGKKVETGVTVPVTKKAVPTSVPPTTLIQTSTAPATTSTQATFKPKIPKVPPPVKPVSAVQKKKLDIWSRAMAPKFHEAEEDTLEQTSPNPTTTTYTTTPIPGKSGTRRY